MTKKPLVHNTFNCEGLLLSTISFTEITAFPAEDRQVVEGEEVVFRVRVSGVPVPKLTWFHNGEEVMADYSKELAEDGSLTIPFAEIKHSGVYRLVAVNRAGRIKKELKLSVDQEGQKWIHMIKHFSPIPVEEFGYYVVKCHANSEHFHNQFVVSTSICVYLITCASQLTYVGAG